MKNKSTVTNIPYSKIPDSHIQEISKTLTKQINKEILEKKYAPVALVLKLVGAGVFLAGSIAIPTLPQALKPFISDQDEREAWKRFNIPYLKRTLDRLEKQKLVKTEVKENVQIVEVTEAGKRKILKYALDTLQIKKPKFWDGKWRLISYDVPGDSKGLRELFRNYLRAWGFYPLHESVFLHAYPCENEIEFLKEYLAIGKYVRIFIVSKIEYDGPFRKFFGV